MEKVKKKHSDFNGNNATIKPAIHIKDHVVCNNGKMLYPCQFCNKVFPFKKSRTVHVKKCSAKDYIMSIQSSSQPEDQKPQISSNLSIIPVKKPSTKIDIQQNIILHQQMDVNKLLSQVKFPPIKLTIRRVPGDLTNHFTISSSTILKEKNDKFDDFDSIAKRLEGNDVTVTKKESSSADDEEGMTCRKCNKEFRTSLELLRHCRDDHTYPKVVMALSEVKKYYSAEDRSKCPICWKPLKTTFYSAFVKHLHTHTTETKYHCKVCNRKFGRLDHMKTHQKRHVSKK